jgi:hypothetical protein
MNRRVPFEAMRLGCLLPNLSLAPMGGVAAAPRAGRWSSQAGTFSGNE